MTTALSSAPAVLSHLRSSGFDVSTNGTSLWVRPRTKLTPDQVEAIQRHRGELIELVAGPDLLRAMLARARENNDLLAKDIGRWIEVVQQAADRARQAEARAEVAEIQARVADMIARRPQQTAVIPPDMLDRLVRLCHPDKHGGSESANRATAWLLSQRRSHS